MITSSPASEPASEWQDEDEIPRPDVSNLITEDDTPVDNLFSEKQMRLLTEPLHASWDPGFPFVVMANVAVYVALNRPAIVPDVLLTTQVEPLPEIMEKDHRSYFSWLYDGKPPEVVIEIVSNTKGNELGSKKRNYEHMGVTYYIVYDPLLRLTEESLQLFALEKGKYRKQSSISPLKEIGLGLTVWEGDYEGVTCPWLRWTDTNGQLIPTGKEAKTAESKRAADESKRASSEAQRAEEALRQNAVLAAKLRELGVDPTTLSI